MIGGALGGSYGGYWRSTDRSLAAWRGPSNPQTLKRSRCCPGGTPNANGKFKQRLRQLLLLTVLVLRLSDLTVDFLIRKPLDTYQSSHRLFYYA